jgi:hypothetical protein
MKWSKFYIKEKNHSEIEYLMRYYRGDLKVSGWLQMVILRLITANKSILVIRLIILVASYSHQMPSKSERKCEHSLQDIEKMA